MIKASRVMHSAACHKTPRSALRFHQAFNIKTPAGVCGRVGVIDVLIESGSALVDDFQAFAQSLLGFLELVELGSVFVEIVQWIAA